MLFHHVRNMAEKVWSGPITDPADMIHMIKDQLLLTRRECWPWHSRTARWGGGRQRSCSSEQGGECATRRGRGGTWSPCPCGCAQDACGWRRPIPSHVSNSPNLTVCDSTVRRQTRRNIRTFLMSWYRSSGISGARPVVKDLSVSLNRTEA